MRALRLCARALCQSPLLRAWQRRGCLQEWRQRGGANQLHAPLERQRTLSPLLPRLLMAGDTSEQHIVELLARARRAIATARRLSSDEEANTSVAAAETELDEPTPSQTLQLASFAARLATLRQQQQSTLSHLLALRLQQLFLREQQSLQSLLSAELGRADSMAVRSHCLTAQPLCRPTDSLGCCAASQAVGAERRVRSCDFHVPLRRTWRWHRPSRCWRSRWQM